ncbi:hypothetical protein BGX38DRAFT_1158708 [Terfezia claveryi]|nr:hypothetical protein BGX38DRAFT_1158708 [Terfezia claveryi]
MGVESSIATIRYKVACFGLEAESMMQHVSGRRGRKRNSNEGYECRGRPSAQPQINLQAHK